MASPAPATGPGALQQLPVQTVTITNTQNRIVYNGKSYIVRLTVDGNKRDLQGNELELIKQILEKSQVHTKNLSRVTIENGTVFKKKENGAYTKEVLSSKHFPAQQRKTTEAEINDLFQQVVGKAGQHAPVPVPAPAPVQAPVPAPVPDPINNKLPVQPPRAAAVPKGNQPAQNKKPDADDVKVNSDVEGDDGQSTDVSDTNSKKTGNQQDSSSDSSAPDDDESDVPSKKAAAGAPPVNQRPAPQHQQQGGPAAPLAPPQQQQGGVAPLAAPPALKPASTALISIQVADTPALTTPLDKLEDSDLNLLQTHIGISYTNNDVSGVCIDKDETDIKNTQYRAFYFSYLYNKTHEAATALIAKFPQNDKNYEILAEWLRKNQDWSFDHLDELLAKAPRTDELLIDVLKAAAPNVSSQEFEAEFHYGFKTLNSIQPTDNADIANFCCYVDDPNDPRIILKKAKPIIQQP